MRMMISRDRLLATHVGSLPRNEMLSDLLVRRDAGPVRGPDSESVDREIRSDQAKLWEGLAARRSGAAERAYLVLGCLIGATGAPLASTIVVGSMNSSVFPLLYASWTSFTGSVAVGAVPSTAALYQRSVRSQRWSRSMA